MTVSVTVGDAGLDYPVAIGAGVPGMPYTPTTAVNVYVVGPLSSPVFQAGRRVAAECPVNWDSLAAAIETLALSMSSLEGTCADGNCALPLRDAVVANLTGAAYYANAASSLVTTAAALQTMATTLAGHTSDVDIEADLAAIGAAVEDLSAEVCELCQHQPGVTWSPVYDAGLPGLPVTYTLDIKNHGTVTTTYAVTLTLPAGTDTFTTTLAPSAINTVEVAVSGVSLGLQDLTAAATAIGPDVTVANLTASALARLNVVDRYVQITAVTADPAFVETGVSSTTLSIDVTNVANVARAATAHTAIHAPGGGLSYTADLALSVLVGAPRTYALGSVDTSGWAEGVYTVTVDLRDGADAVIPDGIGYTYFAVGQALVAGHAVSPTVVAPGSVTVTTVITTEIQADLPFSPDQGGGAASTAVRGAPPTDPARWAVARPQLALVAAPMAVPPAEMLFATAGLTRTEQTSPTITYTGTWTPLSNSRASEGSYYRADDPGETAVFTYTGAWLNLGFFGGPASGRAEVFIDGLSQGVVDLYRHDETPVSYVYGGFLTGTHTLSVTVLGTANTFATNDRVQLDYVDVWDGTALADGVFEQNDGRVHLTPNWGSAQSNGAASGGTYVRDGASTAWFFFTGDSVTYQAIAASNNGWAQVYLDGEYQTDLNLYSGTTVTRSLSFTGLGAGPHMLQVATYRGTSTIDAFITPGTAPFYTPPAPAGFTRFEADDPALLYNGVPFTQTAQTWARSTESVLAAGWASQGQWIGSDTLGDTVNLTFDGVWVSVGFSGEGDAGRAEVFIDGVSQGIVDLYRNEPDALSFSYANLVTGTHTVSVTVLASANPLANGDEVRLDYIDVWDGSLLPDGTFQETDSRVLRSTGWDDSSDANADGGVYMEEGLSSNATAWFAFTGDSLTYQALDYFRSNEVVLRLDGAFVQYADLYTTAAPTQTFSFTGLGAGLHVFQVRHYRSEANVDAFITPATGAPAPPPTPTVFTRHEEDDPALLYNGLPYTLTARSWNRQDDVTYASDGQYFHSAVVSDLVSLAFTGTWVRAGFITDRFGGNAEVFIDGVSQGMVDLYTRDADVTAATFDGLPDTTHTISVTLLSTQHANASDNRLYVDYFDTWDGTALPDGTYEEDDALVWRSDQSENWTTTTDAAASGGAYLTRGGLAPDGTLWFAFTGDSLTYLSRAVPAGGRVTLSVDDVPLGTFNLYNRTAISRTFSFDGFGAGPHVLEARYYRFAPTLDALVTPGTAPFFTTPVYTGVVRYEEDHAALVYGGYSFAQRPQTWSLVTGIGQVSGGRHVSNGTAGSTVSLTFDGRWVSAGFRTRNEPGQAEVFIDGVSQGLVNLDNDASEAVTAFDYANLITGTHTISVSVVSGAVYFDYFDVWDGEAMPDGYVNASQAADSSRLHLSNSLVDVGDAQGIGGDFLAGSLLNVNANVWYSFVGEAFTFLAFSRSGGGTALVYVDDVLVDTVDITYPFTQQPLTFHYSGFGDGPHVVRVSNGVNFRLDAFASNPASLAPYQPIAEWWDDTGKGNGAPFAGTFGLVTALAVGDVDGDGTTEIVAAADDTANWGTLFLYRGDGADTGDGDPIIWERAFATGFADRANLGSPAIADLDGLPGAEIVIAGSMGLYALYNDGTTYWYTDTVDGLLARGTPAIGNLDLDPEPEIVINLDKTLAVFEHDGALAWSTTYTTEAGLPLLADLTGDGLLDIVAYDWANHVYLYDYNYGSPTLEWTVTLSSSTSSLFGSPAVGDIDGQQPGGDDGPEIAITSDGLHTVLDADGSVVFTATLGAGLPGGVSIADVDGDLEVELVTGTRYDDGIGEGRLYVLNADGSLLWEAPAYDSTSANSASVLDLDGDGVYEIAWNGKEQGFTIFNGADGAVIFNEPLALSHTATDYPAIVDVDNDGFAEILAPTLNGLVVFGNDHAWTAARRVWNQHSYHITNINDNLSVPASELNSWETHNTFRTQWAAAVVLPAYAVSLAHTARDYGR